MKNILLYMIAGIVMAGCVKQTLAPSDYVNWVRDESNGLKVEKEIGGQTFTLQYKPSAYEMLMQDEDHSVSQQNLNEYETNSGGLQFFTLTIVTADKQEIPASGGADENIFGERVTYMMSEMQNDFQLIDGNDTLYCVFFHCERNFNISPENNILLGFEKPAGAKSYNDKTLIYSDRILDCGPVKLTIKADDLENIPELLLSE